MTARAYREGRQRGGGAPRIRLRANLSTEFAMADEGFWSRAGWESVPRSRGSQSRLGRRETVRSHHLGSRGAVGKGLELWFGKLRMDAKVATMGRRELRSQFGAPRLNCVLDTAPLQKTPCLWICPFSSSKGAKSTQDTTLMYCSKFSTINTRTVARRREVSAARFPHRRRRQS